MSPDELEYKLKSQYYTDLANNTIMSKKEPEIEMPEYNTLRNILLGGAKEVPEDYDYKGAVKAGFKPDYRNHWGNEFKTAEHITAGDDSIYNTKETPLGKWEQLEKPLPTGEGHSFTPSPYQLDKFGLQNYINYFKRIESGKGGAILKLPK